MDCIAEMEKEIDSYRTNKILTGQGLKDDPEWITKFKEIIEEKTGRLFLE